MRKPVQLNLEEAFIEHLDRACGLVPRSRWVEDKLLAVIGAPPPSEPRSPGSRAESQTLPTTKRVDPGDRWAKEAADRAEAFRTFTQKRS